MSTPSTLRTLLSLVLLPLACTPARLPTSSPAPTPPPFATAPTIRAWALGEPRRPIPVDARGASLGLQRIDLSTTSTSSTTPRTPATPQPGSCSEGLRSLIPLPGDPNVVLLSDATGALHRYTNGTRTPLVAHATALPPIGDLLGFEAAASPLQLLVTHRDDPHQLWTLELGDTQILAATPVGDGLPFADREAFLAHYWVGRCTHATQACLTLVRDDTELSLDRRAHPTSEPELLLSLGQTLVADVRYADPTGASIYLLTAAACEPEPAASPSVEPKAPH